MKRSCPFNDQSLKKSSEIVCSGTFVVPFGTLVLTKGGLFNKTLFFSDILECHISLPWTEDIDSSSGLPWILHKVEFTPFLSFNHSFLMCVSVGQCYFEADDSGDSDLGLPLRLKCDGNPLGVGYAFASVCFSPDVATLESCRDFSRLRHPFVGNRLLWTCRPLSDYFVSSCDRTLRFSLTFFPLCHDDGGICETTDDGHDGTYSFDPSFKAFPFFKSLRLVFQEFLWVEPHLFWYTLGFFFNVPFLFGTMKYRLVFRPDF